MTPVGESEEENHTNKKIEELFNNTYINMQKKGQILTRTRNLLPTGQILTPDPSNPLYDETEGASPFIRYKIGQELPGVIASILESYESLSKPGTKREKIPIMEDGKQKLDDKGKPMYQMSGLGQFKYRTIKTKPIPATKRFNLILAQLE